MLQARKTLGQEEPGKKIGAWPHPLGPIIYFISFIIRSIFTFIALVAFPVAWPHPHDILICCICV